MRPEELRAAPLGQAEPPARIIVTGGLGALGSAVVAKFCAVGARVAVVDRSRTSEAPASDNVFHLLDVDLTDEGAAARTVELACARLGGLDVLVNVAGGFAWETIGDGSPSTWERLHSLNVLTCLNSCRAAISQLNAGGRIINVGAAAAAKAARGMGAYAAAKSGVARLTEALAEELCERGINVNAVLPGIIDTPQNRADMPEIDPRLWTSPAAIADVIHFLASREARAISGALVPVTAPTGDEI